MQDTKPPTSDANDGETQYGFRWGPCEIVRYAIMPDERRVIGVEVNGQRRLDIYISRTGRSVRVFEAGKGELAPRSAV